MKVVTPITITPATYLKTPATYGYSNATDYPEWSVATAYAIGDRVIVDAMQSTFECISANTGNAPVLAPATSIYWIRVGASNAWKPFDAIVSSLSVGYNAASQLADLMCFQLIGLGRFNTVCILSTDAASVRVRFSLDGGATFAYNMSMRAVDTSPVIDAWTYLTADLNVARDFVFEGIDGYGTTSDFVLQIFVQNDGAGIPVEVGEIVVGVGIDIGDCHSGARLTLNDYSRKERNDFGDLTLVERAYSFTGTFEVEIPSARRNKIQSLMADLRATPSVYFPSASDANDGLVVFGFQKSFDITYETPERAYAALEIEGLT